MAQTESETILLEWRRFKKLTDARKRFKTTPCIYIQADRNGAILRVGKAEKGLETRYRGGTGYAIDAAMHDSENQVFAASLGADLVQVVEALLIYGLQPLYNNQGKIKPPASQLKLKHCGEVPAGLLGGNKTKEH